jgi:hypothetical protein
MPDDEQHQNAQRDGNENKQSGEELRIHGAYFIAASGE